MLTSYVFNKKLNSREISEQLLKGDKIILIKNFPLLDEDLIFFIKSFGSPIKENRNSNSDAIFNVTIAKQNNFFRSIANSNHSLPLHTDCADFKSIPNCIALLCVEPAKVNQGASTFASILDILNTLSASEIEKLSSYNWNYRNKHRSILIFKNKQATICYDRITIESFSQITQEDKNYLDKIDCIFDNVSFKTHLKKGDLILFRNDLFLHGRDHFDINSKRLFKRIRFNIDLD